MAEVPRGLTPWKPGQSGNPRGRPRESLLITASLRRFLKMEPDVVWELITNERARKAMSATFADVIALKMLGKAVTDDLFGDQVRRDIMHQVDGRPPVMVEAEDNDRPRDGWNIIVVEQPLGFARPREVE